MNLHEILKRPLLTEKSNVAKSELNQVAFEVDGKADKLQIKKAVETLFKVKVAEVNTLIVHGKVKNVGRYSGRKPNWKKALVTLEKGQNIEFVEGV
jgi:large subunit ribosomal protein L23